MASSLIDKNDCQIHKLADKRVVGIAKVNIECLDFYRKREIDTQVVEGLVKLFQQTRCRRHNPNHYIPVVITQENFKKALRASGLSRSTFATPAGDGFPRFLEAAKDQKFLCLRGLHRARAAQRVLRVDDQWWTVKIFVTNSQGSCSRFIKWSCPDTNIYRRVREIRSRLEKRLPSSSTILCW